MKKNTKISIVVYIVFMAIFIGAFMPMFDRAVGGYDMVDAYLVDFSKSISDIQDLIYNYGEYGRGFMTNFLWQIHYM